MNTITFIMGFFLIFSSSNIDAATKRKGSRKANKARSCSQQVSQNYHTKYFQEEGTITSLDESDFIHLFGISSQEAKSHPLSESFKIIQEVGGFLQSSAITNSTRLKLYQSLAREFNSRVLNIEKDNLNDLRKKTISQELNKEGFKRASIFSTLEKQISTTFSIVPEEITLTTTFANFIAQAASSKGDSLVASTTRQQRELELEHNFHNYIESTIEEINDDKVIRELFKFVLSFNFQSQQDFIKRKSTSFKIIIDRAYNFIIAKKSPDKNHSEERIEEIGDSLSTQLYNFIESIVQDLPSLDSFTTNRVSIKSISDRMKEYESEIRRGEGNMPGSVAKLFTKMKFYERYGVYPITWTPQMVKSMIEGHFREIVSQTIVKMNKDHKESDTASLDSNEIIEPYFYKIKIGKKDSIEQKKNPNKRRNQETYEVQGFDKELAKENSVALVTIDDNPIVLHKLRPYSNRVKKDLKGLSKDVLSKFHEVLLPEILSTPKESGESLVPPYPRTWIKFKKTIYGTPYRVVYEIQENGIELIAIGPRENFYKTRLITRLP